ncbi:MAG: molybdopterin molybdotransferase MoeA [Bacteroidales bacterium]|jgi:molybdopterin molybdotransferase|nr:molybdopterin molybdotransferase MoeA [Bacteroidales bacterium]
MEMITFEQAYETVLKSAFSTSTEKIPFTESLNRVLAGSVTCDIDMPPFNKSSVDGFACQRIDLENELEILETIPAGTAPGKSIGNNQCSRIMTGAIVPQGADCVIMVEDTAISSTGKVKFIGTFKKENIAIKGEDVKRGDVVLKPGRIIRPQDIAVMASAGHTSVIVSKMVKVAVISSGDELVEPSEVPGPAQIRNSNAFQLMAQAERSGTSANYYGIARDDKEETFSVISKAISGNDLVLITGGVSMGDFDFIPSVLERAGVKILFSRVAVQPGKPTTFGVHQKAVVFGLPGNPVSSFMQFEMLVRPLIYKMMGHEWKQLNIRLPMKEKFSRKYADRMAFIPVTVTHDGYVSPVEFHGSAHISALTDSYGIIMLKIGITDIEKGELVNVRQI